MKMGRIVAGFVAGLVSLVGCGGQTQDAPDTGVAAEGLAQSCVFAYFECGYQGPQYPYAWPSNCAVGTHTHQQAAAACHAACSWMCIDTGDIGAEVPVEP